MSSTISNSLFIVILLVPSISFGQEESLSPFETDCQAVETTILSGNLTNGAVLAASSLYLYRHHPKLPELALTLKRSYSGLPPDDARQLLGFEQQQVQGTTNGLAWLNVGLLAEACEDQAAAREAYEKALEDEECCKVPTTYLLAGMAKARIGDTTGAREAYDSAINAASQDADSCYLICHDFAENLFYIGEYGLAREVVEESLNQNNNTPLARAWALAMAIFFADRYDGNEEAAKEKFAELDHIMQSEIENATLVVKNEFEYVHILHRLAKDMVEGSTIARMIADGFVASASFQQMKKEEVADLLQPWIETFTLDDIAALDPEIRWLAMEVFTQYYLAIRTDANTDVIVSLYQQILDHPVLGKEPLNRVNVNCWIGYCLSLANRTDESLAYFDTGLTADEENAIWPAQPSEPHPTFIINGVVPPEDRAKYVANYRNVLSRILQNGGQN